MSLTRGQHHVGQMRDVCEALFQLMQVQGSNLIIGNDNDAPIADESSPTVNVLEKSPANFYVVTPIADRRA